jgi:hypothetical protein
MQGAAGAVTRDGRTGMVVERTAAPPGLELIWERVTPGCARGKGRAPASRAESNQRAPVSRAESNRRAPASRAESNRRAPASRAKSNRRAREAGCKREARCARCEVARSSDARPWHPRERLGPSLADSLRLGVWRPGRAPLSRSEAGDVLLCARGAGNPLIAPGTARGPWASLGVSPGGARVIRRTRRRGCRSRRGARAAR